MTLRRHDRTESKWLRRQNALIDQINRLLRSAAAGEAQFGAAGVTFAAPPPTRLALFELFGPLVYPDGEDPDEPQVPYTDEAAPLWFFSDDDAYAAAGLSAPETLYHPQAHRDGEDRPLGIAALGPGMRCLAWHNPQSGRWEIVEPPLGLLRFEMTDALACGGSAEVVPRLYLGGDYADDPLDRTVVVHDSSRRFSKMATAPGDGGARGWAWWMPDRQGWEILDMQVPVAFFGALKYDLSQADASATVEIVVATGVLDGYNIFGENFGNEIVACNPAGGGNFAGYWHAGKAGDRVFCRWDVRGAKYWMLAVEPGNHEYQSLDVVTGVDFVAQTVATKTIQLPPWAEIA